jgi:hypothetical protein
VTRWVRVINPSLQSLPLLTCDIRTERKKNIENEKIKVNKRIENSSKGENPLR